MELTIQTIAIERFSLIDVAEKSPNISNRPILSLVDLRENIGRWSLGGGGDGSIFEKTVVFHLGTLEIPQNWLIKTFIKHAIR